MNYRHAYHAGNFADVFKHAILSRVLVHLAQKPAPFRLIDTHAGAGLYDLSGPEAEKTGEWREGIGRLRGAALSPELDDLLAPYLVAVAAHNPSGGVTLYPGSPAIGQTLMRPQDRLIASESEPNAAALLAETLRHDARAKALALDGWTALRANVPPKERRGVVLVDPPFEEPGEFNRLVQGLEAAHRKWPTGIYLLWYPLKDAEAVKTFARDLKRLGCPKTLRAEMTVAGATEDGRLRGTGLVAVNPPWLLYGELQRLLPALAQALSRDGRHGHRLDWLVAESNH